eukprot:SAG11_NODE_1034_length_6091_cov_6.237984_4_plen_57_part_00
MAGGWRADAGARCICAWGCSGPCEVGVDRLDEVGEESDDRLPGGKSIGATGGCDEP